MIALISDLFINLCVLIALIFIFLQLRRKVIKQKLPNLFTTTIEGVAGGLLGFILMVFSIQVTNETIVDLRFVPVMLIILFIGVKPAIISAIIIIIGRFYLGVTISSIAALVMMILLLLGFILIHKVQKLDENLYKKSSYMIFYSNVVFTIIISFLVRDVVILKDLLISYWTISIIGGLTAVFFFDYIRKTHALLLQYEKESTTDFLTGLNNVRTFDATWNSLIQNAEKHERFSLLIIDIDHFKKVNDEFGHPVGDKILVELGKILKVSTRSHDLVSRNGGEEFSVILLDCPNRRAIKIAERIRKAVEVHEFPVSSEKNMKVTVSIGVASYPETICDMTKMINLADDCLYRAKRSGRNKVCAV
ncbi:diguanylate cyclase [Evansella sp. AB-rgal1]|uniref:diguanylate cyclase n=1 Tax=Evansella sp. AB-rgal1 TaxID=3242696 RepID=UPI00359CE9C5